MPSKKKIYRTVFRFEVLSEEPLDGTETLNEILEETDTGCMSGNVLECEVHNEVLVGGAAVKAVKSQGSDPAFFMMDEGGYEIEM